MTIRLSPRSSSSPGQIFGIGVTLGVVVGLIVGSLLAIRLGDETLTAIRNLVERISARDDRVNFELLLQ